MKLMNPMIEKMMGLTEIQMMVSELSTVNHFSLVIILQKANPFLEIWIT